MLIEISMKILMRGAGAVILAVMALGSVHSADMPAAGAAVAITHISGGIGDAEQQQFAAREQEFNLKLVFSLTAGNYLADVTVLVSDAKGHKLIEHVAEGPLFMARLPAGEYQVAVTHRGKTLNRKTRLADHRLRTEHFRWPADPQDDLPVSRWLDKE
jgi:hypothetical protein